MELPWVLAVCADDPLAARPRVEPADLAGIRHIRLPENSASRAHLDAAFAESGIRIRSDTSVADWDTALLLAELGLGHAVVPALPGWRVPGRAARCASSRSRPCRRSRSAGPSAAGRPSPRWPASSPTTVARSCTARAARQQ